MNEPYLRAIFELNERIKKISLNYSDRNCIKDKINAELLDIFYANKKERYGVHKNVRLLKPTLVFKNELFKNKWINAIYEMKKLAIYISNFIYLNLNHKYMFQMFEISPSSYGKKWNRKLSG